MPLSVECSYQGRTISLEEALRLKAAWHRGQPKPAFTCVECGQPVTPHQSRNGHTPHIEHRKRNPSCSLSHRSRDPAARYEYFSPDDERAIEGYKLDRQTFVYGRNAELAEARKRRDGYKCVACGFHLKVGDRYVIECHHTRPLSQTGEREVAIGDLVSLCPTCHRIAHLRSVPYSVAEIAALLKRTAESAA
ncbi:HNH endonuclease [Rubrivivax albus]|uniref:C2H2-type domain-containing protein n=1 Tax=Rubrivivax albus TaxID=2499835 RepID=A0A437JJP6_9BURK|nr:HNH endonuclease [Rubrivivax albus]RVT46821.1 hypothetical protein ENE75_24560 [Rubrivivax albus]